MGGRKFVQLVQVTLPRWPPYPYLIKKKKKKKKKTYKNLLLRNQKADDIETWYAALGARVLSSFFQ